MMFEKIRHKRNLVSTATKIRENVGKILQICAHTCACLHTYKLNTSYLLTFKNYLSLGVKGIS